jgi:hypothetical protein
MFPVLSQARCLRFTYPARQVFHTGTNISTQLTVSSLCHTLALTLICWEIATWSSPSSVVNQDGICSTAWYPRTRMLTSLKKKVMNHDTPFESSMHSEALWYLQLTLCYIKLLFPGGTAQGLGFCNMEVMEEIRKAKFVVPVFID